MTTTYLDRKRDGRMTESSERFRNRAIDCRALAKGARHAVDAAMLEEIADELDEEARKIESKIAAEGEG